MNGCVANDSEQYKNVAEFQSEISTWGLIGKLKSDANQIAVNKGFICDDKYCYKDLPGLVCNQRLRFTFETSVAGIVQDYDVWEINGKLPSQCL